MKDARFTIPTPALLAKVVDMIDQVPMEERDTKGDFYEYMLGKIATAGQNGQFRTPRHIIRLMVEMTAPQPDATSSAIRPAARRAFSSRRASICASATRRFFATRSSRDTSTIELFHGFDFDNTMLRIGSMNMLLHGVENPDIRYRDSLAQDHAGEEEKYTLVLANPPFAGSLDYENTAKDLQQIVKTKKTELLFLALFLRLLKPGGRAAVIVPDGVLFGSSNAHKTLRKILVEEQKLDAVISLPGGVFKPYAGVSTAILVFTKTNSGGTDHVWFYDVDADGMSLDDKRTELLPLEKLGPVPQVALTADEHAKNNLPDILARWRTLHLPIAAHPLAQRAGVRVSASELTARRRRCVSYGGELARTRTGAIVPACPRPDHRRAGHDLSLNRYKEVVHEEVAHRPPSRNPRQPRQTGGGGSAGHEGTGGDAE